MTELLKAEVVKVGIADMKIVKPPVRSVRLAWDPASELSFMTRKKRLPVWST